MAAVTGGRVTVKQVGSQSIQGDAQFCRVLEQMGCTVEQTETLTTVEGPKDDILKPVTVDMNAITDTFLTAAVVMALCPVGSISTINNISNQRVKECNRIEAMITELRKCGVRCEEHATGLIVYGSGRHLQGAHSATSSTSSASASASLGHVHIACYKDHRVAMSFGVLGCAVPSIVITDKDCTDKTYPDFWDDVCTLTSRPDAVLAAPVSPTMPQNKRCAFVFFCLTAVVLSFLVLFASPDHCHIALS